MLRKEWGVVIVGVMVIAFPVVISIGNIGGSDQLSNMLQDFTRLDEIHLDRIIRKFEQECPMLYDKGISDKFSTCLETNFVSSTAEKPDNFTEIYRTACKNWPVARRCLKPFIKIIHDCWSVGDKVNSVMDNIANLVCADRTRAKIEVLYTGDGMSCVVLKHHEVEECIMNADKTTPEIFAFPKEKDMCKFLKIRYDCSHQGLQKCEDPNPDELNTSLFQAFSKAVGCSTIHDPQTDGASNYRTTSKALLLLPCILVTIVLNLF